jgi:LacI family transcriptional regulator
VSRLALPWAAWQTLAGMASLADISRRAGTSVATASRVLNGSTHPVSEATRARVLQAAADLGYAPSALAQALVTRSSRIIGVIVNDIVDPYFAEIARGVEDVAGRMGYLVMVCNADHRVEAEIEYVSALRDYHAEGLVFAGSGAPGAGEVNAELATHVEAARARGARVVALAHRDFPALRVGVDNAAAAYDVTDYLISLGHRRIAFVEGPPELYTSEERRAGFSAAMSAAGLSDELRFSGGFDFESGLAAGRRLLTCRPLLEAVVAANDEAAIGVLTSFRHAEIDVPGQVSVAGIDDTRPARFVELTTVNLPLYDLGAVAARHILAGEEAPDEDVVLAHRLVPRRSTARRR